MQQKYGKLLLILAQGSYEQEKRLKNTTKKFLNVLGLSKDISFSSSDSTRRYYESRSTAEMKKRRKVFRKKEFFPVYIDSHPL